LNTMIQIRSHSPAGKMMGAWLSLTMALVALALVPHSAYAQFIPCKIVNLNVIPPTLVQAGQPFQVTINLTVSCDPSVLPIVRVDLVDATNSATVSTNSVPYYPSASSFTASVTNQGTAPNVPGSWALEVHAYVISGLNGQAVASTAQLFQLNVEPYTPAATETQTMETTTQISISSLAPTTQLLPVATEFENATTPTTTTMSSELAVSPQSATPTDQLLVPAAILLVGVLAFGFFMFTASRRKQTTATSKHCGQCGAELNHDEKYCTNCGAKSK